MIEGDELRSYKLRRSRMGETRRAALGSLLERYSIPDDDSRLDLDALFPGRPVVLEIGFGMGTSTLAMAREDPATGVVAAEVHTPGMATLLQGLEEHDVANVRVLLGDGRELLQDRIAPGSLAGVRVFFPDPWPKGRHHKRRLVDPAFAALVADRLAPGGVLHLATDWEHYAEQMAAVVSAEPALELTEGRERPQWRPVTRYEARGLAAGHQVSDLLARRRTEPG